MMLNPTFCASVSPVFVSVTDMFSDWPPTMYLPWVMFKPVTFTWVLCLAPIDSGPDAVGIGAGVGVGAAVGIAAGDGLEQPDASRITVSDKMRKTCLVPMRAHQQHMLRSRVKI
jgi:hypothetical protein